MTASIVTRDSSHLHALPRSPLWPHQGEAVTAIEGFLEDPGEARRGLLVLPPGAGKTVAAVEGRRTQLEAGARVLWLAPSWVLCRQAADTAIALGVEEHRLGRPPSSAAARSLPLLYANTGAQVVLSTIQTFTGSGRAARAFCGQHFDLIVLDEAHWGQGGSRLRLLEGWVDFLSPRPLLLELTATPVEGQKPHVIFSCGRAELEANEILARAVVEEIDTGVRWNPVREDADFAGDSLTQLVVSPGFTETVARTWAEERHRWGKTLVCCIDIEHANQLRNALYERGASAAVLHSDVPESKRRGNLDRFRRSEIQVLVQVAMLNQGVDIPDLQSVFVARPALSRTLYEQLVGRGARRTPTKETFNVVDFVVASKRHAGDFWSGSRLYPGDPKAPRPASRPARHGYEPAEIEVYRGHPDADGLDLAPMQTFGIEFELTNGREDISDREFRRRGDAILQALREHLPWWSVADGPVGYGEADHMLWNVARDSSCGWEVTTPILGGHEGFTEVLRVLPILEEAAAREGLRVNCQTGTHIHLGWVGNEHLTEKLLQFATTYEPAFFSLVSPSRYGNEYCDLLRPLSRNRRLNPHGRGRRGRTIRSRYNWLNISPLYDEDKGTIEIRLHNGTLNGPKILAWVSLWMRILDAVLRGVEPSVFPWGRVPALPLSTGKAGDIERVCRDIGASWELTEKLIHRRREVVAGSWVCDREHHQRAWRALGRWCRFEGWSAASLRSVGVAS